LTPFGKGNFAFKPLRRKNLLRGHTLKRPGMSPAGRHGAHRAGLAARSQRRGGPRVSGNHKTEKTNQTKDGHQKKGNPEYHGRLPVFQFLTP